MTDPDRYRYKARIAELEQHNLELKEALEDLWDFYTTIMYLSSKDPVQNIKCSAFTEELVINALDLVKETTDGKS